MLLYNVAPEHPRQRQWSDVEVVLLFHLRLVSHVSEIQPQQNAAPDTNHSLRLWWGGSTGIVAAYFILSQKDVATRGGGLTTVMQAVFDCDYKRAQCLWYLGAGPGVRQRGWVRV